MAQLVRQCQVSEMINVDLRRVNAATVVSIDCLGSPVHWVRKALCLHGYPGLTGLDLPPTLLDFITVLLRTRETEAPAGGLLGDGRV